MHTAVIELSMVIVITPLLALGVACFDPVWCRTIISTTGVNFGKIWMSGAVVATLMMLVGMECGAVQALPGMIGDSSDGWSTSTFYANGQAHGRNYRPNN